MKKNQTAEKTQAKASLGRGYAILVLFAFLIAWQTPLARILQDRGTPSIGTITMLFVVAAVLINVIDLVTGRFKAVYAEGRKNAKVLVPMGAINFFGGMGLFFSVHTLDAGVAVALLYLAPAFICIFFLITKIKPVPFWQRIAVVICICGCLLAVNVLQNSLAELSIRGILFALLSAACSGAYMICNDMVLPRSVDRWTAITIVLDVAAVLSIFAYPGMFERFMQLQLLDIVIFLYLAGVTKILCLQLMLIGTRIVGAARSAVVQSMEIPFTLLVAFITLRQMLTPVQFIGIGLVILSVILMQKE